MNFSATDSFFVSRSRGQVIRTIAHMLLAAGGAMSLTSVASAANAPNVSLQAGPWR